MNKLANPTEISTPHLASAFENEAKDAVEFGDKTLEDNWINREVKLCKQCEGSGLTADAGIKLNCIACDGTGADMIIEYGVEDSKFVSRVIQNGMRPLMELCKELRDEEMKLGLMNRAKRSAFKAFLLPESVKMELEMLEPEFPKWVKEGNNKRAAKLVRKHYPALMTTNYLF